MHYEGVEAFSAALRALYGRTRDKGTVWLSAKRTTFATQAARRKAMRAAQEAGLSAAAVADAKHTGGKDVKAEGACLVRATDGDKKISVRVGAAEYKAFQRTVAALMREQTTALKKRDRTKEKAAAKKKAKSS
jgi:signal recognition particle subunit SRP14